MNVPAFKFKLHIVSVQDPSSHGYTSYFAEMPEIISQGHSKSESIRNLFQAAAAVNKYKYDQAFGQIEPGAVVDPVEFILL